MTISWHGFNYFKLQNSTQSLIFNPYSLDNSGKLTKAKADMVVFSDPEQVTAAKLDEDVFIVATPGEYEKNGVFVYGQPLNGHIIYVAIMDNIKVAFLGEIGHGELPAKALEMIEGVDILILPVGGGQMMNAKEASNLISRVEPRLVIPSAYAGTAGKLKLDSLETFVKEFGVKPEETDKLKVSKKDLPQEDVKLITLKVQ